MVTFPLDQTLILNLQAMLLLPALAFAALQNPPIAKPGCLDNCGGTPIPFPFGTTPDCYRSYYFRVICNHTFNPPKPFYDGWLEIKDLSLSGQLTALQFISKSCYYAQNGSTISNEPYVFFNKFFTFNNTANKFTIVGCDSYGFVFGRGTGREYKTGCTAWCRSESDVQEGSCMGLGCCQTSIPKNVRQVNVSVKTYTNYSDVRGISNCTYGFLVEDTAFKFTSKNLTNLKNVKKLPVVVDWAIGNSTCKEAKKNSTDYACKSANSSCYEPDNGYGYRCRCNHGYHGNPYLRNGCHDIDECSLGWKKYCRYRCVNTEGGFNCPCPKGYRGDGKIEGKGCTRGDSRTVWLVAGVATGIILLLLLSCLAYVEYKRRQLKRAKRKWFIQNGGELLLERMHKREESHDIFKIFNSTELKKATNDFHKSNIVGRGGFGTVYKGILSDKRIVAIKKSKIVDPDQIEQFVNEVVVISQTNHRNIVKLLGCCLETEVPLLVYEFISNGALYSHLHDPTKACFLNWEIRLRIATETATVLWYLHSLASNPIIHRDVKSDNILLDKTFTAKVSDFGASRLIALDQTQISTVVQGTTGYLDPEYLQTHQLTAKSDVYSFGVVLLELLTGRKAVSYVGPENERSLVIFFLSMLEQEEKLFTIIDGNIANEENREQIVKVARLADRCLKVSGKDRPTMNMVAMELESLRVGRMQSVDQTKQDANYMKPLFEEGFDGTITESGCGSGISAGFDSFEERAIPALSGGR